MTSGRENYRRTIEFADPQYLPVSIGVDTRWLKEKDQGKLQRIGELQSRFPDDLMGGLGCWMVEETEQGENGVVRWTDEWGVGWIDDGHGARPSSHPLEEGYHCLDSYSFPDPLREGRFAEQDRALERRGDRYVVATVWFTLFERLWMLRGFNDMLTDPYLSPEEFARLRDRVVETNLAMVDAWLERDVDAVFFSDDWGCQRGMLMDPDDWRSFYAPSYERIFSRVREGGAHVWMHLCGDITSILPDLISMGLNVLNPVQPQAMNPCELGDRFGGKVCFHGGVDVQGTLIVGSTHDVREEVHTLVRAFGSYGGGYIGGTSHSIMPETPLDNVIAMYEAFAEYVE